MIPPQIRADLGDLVEELLRLGYRLEKAHYSHTAFGNWYVRLRGPVNFMLTRDRGQFLVYSIDDPPAHGELPSPAAQERVLNDAAEFVPLIRAWAIERATG